MQQRGVPVAGGISAHWNVARARHGSQSRKPPAASKTPMVFAAACSLHAWLFQTFVLDVLLDGLHLLIRRFLHAHSTSAYRLEALNGLCTMACMRACILVALPARFSRFAPVPNGGPSRSWAQNAHAVHPEGARSVSKRVCSLSYTSVNTFKPLSNARISQFSRPFILPAGSVRPS